MLGLCHRTWGCRAGHQQAGPALLSRAFPVQVPARGPPASLHTGAASAPAGARPQTQVLNVTRHVGIRTGSDRDTTSQNGLSSDLKLTSTSVERERRQW